MEEFTPELETPNTPKISRHRKTIYIVTGIITLLLLVSLAGEVVDRAYENSSQIPAVTPTPQSVMISPTPHPSMTTVTLKATDGEVEIYHGQEKPGTVFYQMSVLEEQIFFIKDEKLGSYNKLDRKISYVNIPERLLLEYGSEGAFSVRATQLDEDTYLIVFHNDALANSSYVFRANDNTLTPIPIDDDPCDVFCSFIKRDHTISTNEFILERGVGDACWYKGSIFYLNTTNVTADKIMDFENGCATEHDSYNGSINNMVIASTHEWAEYPEDKLYEHRNLHLSLYALTPDGVKTVLLTEDEIPADITYIYTLEDQEDVFMLAGRDDYPETKYYRYNLQNDTVTQVDQDSIPQDDPYDYVSMETVLEQNSEYITFQTN